MIYKGFRSSFSACIFFAAISLMVFHSCDSSKTFATKFEINKGDTIYLIKPITLVREHFSKSQGYFTVDPARNEKVSAILACGIELYGKKKVNMVNVISDQKALADLLVDLEPLLKNFNDSLQISSSVIDKLSDSIPLRNTRFVISYMEWDYPTWELYSDMELEYYGTRVLHSAHATLLTEVSSMNLYFIVIEGFNGKVIFMRNVVFGSPEFKKPEFGNMKFDIESSMKPFLKQVKKNKKGM
jgi:hypothetical protein